MLPIQKKMQLITIGVIYSFGAVLLTYFFSESLPEKLDVTKNLEFYLYNVCYRASSAPPDTNLVIVKADDRAQTRNRVDYANMIRALHRAGAKCIALDILFDDERENARAGDQALVKSVAACPEVILAIKFDTDHRPSDLALAQMRQLALPDSLHWQTLIPLNTTYRGVTLPFDSLLFVAKHLGHITSLDKQYHHFPPVMVFDQKCYGSMPVEIARLCFGAENDSSRLSGTSATGGNGSTSGATKRPFHLADIPLDKYGRTLVNFIPYEAFRSRFYSWEGANQLLQYRPEQFRGAVVIITNPSAEESLLPTPVGPYPSWALLASLTNQFLFNRHIGTSVGFGPLVLNAALVSLGLIWLLFWAPRLDKKWRRTRFIFGVGSGLCLLLVFLFLRYGQQWFGVVAPLLGFNASMLLVRAKYYKMTKQPEYMDFELSVAEGESQNYSIQVIKSPVGEEEAKASFQSFLEEQSFQRVLQRLNALQASREDLKWIGNKLFSALFPSAISGVLTRSLDFVKNEGKDLRLKLRLDAPELINLPWEFMHSAKLPPGFLVLHKRLSLSRYIPLEQPLKKPQFRVPLRILVLISSPANLPPLDVAEEKKLIKKSLRPLMWARDIHLKICDNLTRSVLANELERDPPDVLHYIGHSKFDSKKNKAFLALEVETSRSDKVDREPRHLHLGQSLSTGGTHGYDEVDAEELGNLLLETPVKLVLLNSCQGAASAQTDAFIGLAQNLVRVGVPAVVAMQYEIPDASAVMFSRIFYSTLIKHYSVDDAVAMVRRYIAARVGLKRQDWATPVLFMRAYEGKVFEMES